MDATLNLPRPVNRLALIAKARLGLSRSMAETIANQIGLTDKEMAYILNISERTYRRNQADSVLDYQASERLLLLSDLVEHGLSVFDGRADVLNHWLRSSLPELGRQTPLALLDSVSGFGLVDDVLGRIEHGVFS